MLGHIREAGLRGAARHPGLKEVSFLNAIDGEVDQVDPGEIIAKITAYLRRIRPHVVVTFPPDGNYGHPDHIALAQLSAGALLCAADASYRDPEDRAPFRVSKLYHMVDSKNMVQTVREAIGPITMEVDGVERNHFGWEEWSVTTRIDTLPYFDQAWQAILCRQSQLPVSGLF